MAHSPTDPNDNMDVQTKPGLKFLSVRSDGHFQFLDSSGTWTASNDHTITLTFDNVGPGASSAMAMGMKMPLTSATTFTQQDSGHGSLAFGNAARVVYQLVK